MPSPTAADVGVSHSLEFVRRECGRGRARLLEVGCGDGALAAALVEHDFDVTGIDHDPRRVARARRRGVEAACADFLTWTPQRSFDAILFSRSLHHLRSPHRAVRRATGLLSRGGRLLVEEFAVDSVDGPTAAWLYATAARLGAAGLLSPGRRRAPAGTPLARWRREHAGLARSAVLRRAVGAHFRIREEAVPYLYRYFLTDLGAGVRAFEAARALLRDEAALVRSGTIRAVGRRFVGTPHTRPPRGA